MDLIELRENLADVLQAECSLEKIHQSVNGHLDLESRLMTVARDLGWMTVCVAEDAGGLGLGLEAVPVLGQEFGRALAPASLGNLLLASHLLSAFAPDHLKDRYLERAMDGRLKVAIDASLLGDDRGEGQYYLGSHEADIVFARITPENAGGPELGLIENEGGECGLVAVDGWDVTRSLSRGTSAKGRVHGLGVAAYHAAVNAMSLLLASDSLGLGEAIATRTVDYLGIREQFGKKLGTFQALKHRMADIFIEQRLDGALIDVAVSAFHPETGLNPWALLAKTEISDAAAFANEECLQLHGGIGFTWEHECHFYMKRARLNQAMIGDNARIRVQAAQILVPQCRVEVSGKEPADANG